MTEAHRLLKLYLAARDGGRNPDPGSRTYRAGEKAGVDTASRAVGNFLATIDTRDHVKSQYTFGYYDGVVKALREWADVLDRDRLVEVKD